MTMHDISQFTRPQASAPAFWHDFDSFPLASFRREFGRLFEDFFKTPQYGHAGYKGYPGTFTNWPMLDVKDFDKEVLVTAELPGLTDKNFELFFDKGMLTIRGEKKGEKDEFGYSEFFYGKFERQVPLPYSFDLEHCVTDFTNGLLTIRLPKLTEVENTKKIPVNGSVRK